MAGSNVFELHYYIDLDGLLRISPTRAEACEQANYGRSLLPEDMDKLVGTIRLAVVDGKLFSYTLRHSGDPDVRCWFEVLRARTQQDNLPETEHTACDLPYYVDVAYSPPSVVLAMSRQHASNMARRQLPFQYEQLVSAVRLAVIDGRICRHDDSGCRQMWHELPLAED